MKKYEIMYILKASLNDEERQTAMKRVEERLTANGAEVSKTTEWGLRTLAYEIEKETKGFYIILKVNAPKEALDEFNRLTRIDHNVLRYLITVDLD